jgi:hypothetical protein
MLKNSWTNVILFFDILIFFSKILKKFMNLLIFTEKKNEKKLQKPDFLLTYIKIILIISI